MILSRQVDLQGDGSIIILCKNSFARCFIQKNNRSGGTGLNKVNTYYVIKQISIDGLRRKTTGTRKRTRIQNLFWLCISRIILTFREDNLSILGNCCHQVSCNQKHDH